jgi:hypothetical protein
MILNILTIYMVFCYSRLHKLLLMNSLHYELSHFISETEIHKYEVGKRKHRMFDCSSDYGNSCIMKTLIAMKYRESLGGRVPSNICLPLLRFLSLPPDQRSDTFTFALGTDKDTTLNVDRGTYKEVFNFLAQATNPDAALSPIKYLRITEFRHQSINHKFSLVLTFNPSSATTLNSYLEKIRNISHVRKNI